MYIFCSTNLLAKLLHTLASKISKHTFVSKTLIEIIICSKISTLICQQKYDSHIC